MDPIDIAKTLINEGQTQLASGDYEGAAEVCNEVVRRFGDRDDVSLALAQRCRVQKKLLNQDSE